jgi:hypothetical protein
MVVSGAVEKLVMDPDGRGFVLQIRGDKGKVTVGHGISHIVVPPGTVIPAGYLGTPH